MNKQEFLDVLAKELSGLPQDDTAEVISFYSEMIADGIEDGLSEEEAIASAGDISEIVKKAISDIPLTKIAKERIKKNRKLKTLEIVLLAVGSPIWLALGVSALAVVLSLYVSFWAVIVSFWAIFASLIGGALSGVAALVIFCYTNNLIAGFATLSAGIVCAGLSIFAFFGCKAATKGLLILTKKMIIAIKNCFIKKEAA